MMIIPEFASKQVELGGLLLGASIGVMSGVLVQCLLEWWSDRRAKRRALAAARDFFFYYLHRCMVTRKRADSEPGRCPACGMTGNVDRLAFYPERGMMRGGVIEVSGKAKVRCRRCGAVGLLPAVQVTDREDCQHWRYPEVKK